MGKNVKDKTKNFQFGKSEKWPFSMCKDIQILFNTRKTILVLT